VADLPAFELTPDFSRNPQATARPSVVRSFFDNRFTVRLDAFAREHGVKRGSVYLAALAALLSRYSGETTMILDGGNHKFRFELNANPDFADLLRQQTNAPCDLQIRFGGAALLIARRADGDQLTCEFDQHLFRADTMERLLQHLHRLLSEALSHPEKKVSEVFFLSAEEHHRLTVGLNQTSLDYPRELTVYELFERSATQSPSSVAVAFGERTLTYFKLEARANQLAHYLTERGAGPGAIVGILLDRSFEMMVALLAVLKTGSAYLPLDPAFPSSRLEFMLADAGAAILVSSSAVVSKIAANTSTILLDQEQSAIERMPPTRLARHADVESLAYVLYTSGSTGKPKGVQIQHRSVVNLLYGMQEHVQLQPQDALLAVTTLSFDIAGLELLLPLMTGAHILLASHAQAADPIALRDLIQKAKPALMQATPSTWRMLIDSGWEGLKNLKILVGGEKVTREVADALLSRGAAVWNCYGPTETTIWSTICRLERDGKPVTIGRPIANTSLFILDAHRQLVPQGAIGELYIGGDGVALGYLNRPELNAERFLSNPFGTGKIYKTGDLVRYQPDGRVEILGRNDAQVKVRGFRIELGDVEEALSACPYVRAAAVVVRTAASGESVLAGYFVPDGSVGGSAIRTWLMTRLPDYMVPTFLVPMKSLPLTPNGKIDRNALPLPHVEAPLAPEVEPAADRLEATLIGIWESVLGVRPVGRTQNFFDLGGHSVLAAKAFARMEKTLGTALPLATLFQAPTVAKLAQVIRNSNWKPLWSSLVAIRPAGAKPPFFFVHPIGGNVLNFSGFCGHFGPDRPIYGLQARGLNGEEIPHIDVKEMAADYVRSIRSVQPEGPYYIGGFSAGGVVAYEMAQQLEAAGQHVATLALLDTLVLTRHLKDGPLGRRLRHAARTIRMNLRYAWRMSLPEFVKRKSSNVRMRSRLLLWAIGERFGRRIQPSRLTAEEAFLLALRRYTPEPYQGNATLFRAGDGSNYPDPKLGWEGLIEGHLDIQQVSGDHDTILLEPHIGMLANLLEDCLERAPRPDLPKSSNAGEQTSQRLPMLTPAIELGKP
jgi:amino acid adenylation domain-containing protein